LSGKRGFRVLCFVEVVIEAERHSFQRNKKVVWSVLDNECILLHLESHVYYTLNASGRFLWESLAEKKSFHRLLEDIMNRHDVDAETARGDLTEILEDLVKEGLVECDEIPVSGTGAGDR
jgi:hypothetical protein